jgi:signal transduction histidine kinase
MAFSRIVSSILRGVPQPQGGLTGERHDSAPGSTEGGAPRPAAPSGVQAEDAATARALDELRALERSAARDLPPVLSSQLRQIDDLLRVVVGTIHAQDASTEQRVLLSAMIGDYLSTPLRAYLALPASDRTDDSQATRAIAAQLELLEKTVHDLLNQIRIGAIEELSTHGRFLADKFQSPDPGLVLGGR